MTESAAPRPSGPSPEALPSPSERPGVPCDRCGTFIQEAPEKIGPRLLCESCAVLLRKELRLYPTWYIYLWGILGNFAFAGIFSAINWKRLGDKTRMRNAIIMAVFGVVLTAAVIALQFRSYGGLIINIFGTRGAVQSLDDVYQRHKAAGGARANLLWPLVITVGAILLMAIGYAVYLDATGQLEDEP
jgi:hypothetical protein